MALGVALIFSVANLVITASAWSRMNLTALHSSCEWQNRSGNNNHTLLPCDIRNHVLTVNSNNNASKSFAASEIYVVKCTDTTYIPSRIVYEESRAVELINIVKFCPVIRTENIRRHEVACGVCGIDRRMIMTVPNIRYAEPAYILFKQTNHHKRMIIILQRYGY